MKDFEIGQSIICIHDDFNLYKEGGKKFTEGPREGDIVTFNGYINNKAFLLLEEYPKTSDGRPLAFNSIKFAPLEDDEASLLKEAEIAVQELEELLLDV